MKRVYIVTKGERGQGASPQAVFSTYDLAFDYILDTYPNFHPIDRGNSRYWTDSDGVDRVYIGWFIVDEVDAEKAM